MSWFLWEGCSSPPPPGRPCPFPCDYLVVQWDGTVARLTAEAVTPGDRIALLSPQHPEAALLCWGALAMGATLVPMDHRLSPPAVALRVCCCMICKNNGKRDRLLFVKSSLSPFEL